MGMIIEQVALANADSNAFALCKVRSGWVIIGNVQILPGYCLLFPDPVVASLNDLSEERRALFLLDMARIGDAILVATDAYRINYEILGNSAPELHAHIFPRFRSEPDERRRGQACFYDWDNGPKDAPLKHRAVYDKIRGALEAGG